MHVAPVIVNERAVCGENVTLYPNSGIVSAGSNWKEPVVGDDCIIGMGAVVLGGAILPKGTVVGANSVVNKTFSEENVTLAGVPARKVSEGGSDKYITNASKKDFGI